MVGVSTLADNGIGSGTVRARGAARGYQNGLVRERLIDLRTGVSLRVDSRRDSSSLAPDFAECTIAPYNADKVPKIARSLDRHP